MPGQNFDVYFSQDSAVVSASEMLRLANWTTDQRIKYPRQEVFQIDGRAEERERNPQSLARCHIPDDCIDSKRYPLFMARAVLKELIESLQSTQGVKPC